YRGHPSAGLRRFDDHVYTAYHTWRWMPSNSDPGDKATFRLSIAVPAGWRVVASGAPEAAAVAGAGAASGSQRHRWSLATPHAAYLFGFAAGRLAASGRAAASGAPALDVLATDRTPPAIVARTLDETPGMIRFFEEASGVPFPGGRYAVAFVGGGAQQEAAGFSLLGDDYAASW